MPLIAIVGPVADPALSEILSPTQYQAICSAVSTARNNACCYACAVEWGVCLITQFWCIFCCHACIENQFAHGQLQK